MRLPALLMDGNAEALRISDRLARVYVQQNPTAQVAQPLPQHSRISEVSAVMGNLVA